MEQDSVNLTERISYFLNKTIKEEKRFTQVDVARIMDVSPASVNKWLNGGSPTIDKLPLLCDMLDISPNELFDYPERIPKEAWDIFNAFNAHPEYQQSICKLLGLILEDIEKT